MLDRGHMATVGRSKALVVGNVVALSTGKSMPVPIVLGEDQRAVDRGRSLQMLRESSSCEQSWKKKEQAEHFSVFFSALLVSGPSVVS